MTADRYFSLGTFSEGILREKASRFFAFAFPIADEAEFGRRCDAIAHDHHASRHVCFAWVLGTDGERFRANDAGEPSGTAGRPILRQLQAAHLTHAAVVVVRYFGGTLLGKGGLVHAYGEAARIALAANTIVEHVVRDPLRVVCGYPMVEALKSDVLLREGEIDAADYGERCTLHVRMPRGIASEFMERWRFAGATVDRDQP